MAARLRRRCREWSVLLAVLGPLVAGRALGEDEPVAHPLTRAEAVSLALNQGPDLAAARPLVVQSRAGEQVAGQLPNPTLGASLGPDDPTFFVTLDQRLPLFGQRASAIAAAQAEAQVGVAEFDVRALQVRVTAQRVYTALALAEAELQLSRDTAALAKDLAVRIRSKVTNRLAPELDAQQAELNAERAAQEVVDRRAAVVDAQVRLAQVLGLPLDLDVVTREALTVPEAPLVPDSQHPELVAAEREQAAASARVSREEKAVRPVPTVGIQLERLPPPPDGSGRGASLGVRGSLSFELPVLSQNNGAVARESAGVNLAEANLRRVSSRLQAGRRQAEVRFGAALARAHFSSEALVPGAKKVADLASNAYDLGRAPLVTLLQARADLNRALAAAVESAAQAWDAREDLEEVSGVLP
jgi:outer membrane protein, heavy metal efflux system